jgi:Zn-dependent protease/CBS domain-containing protein
MSTEAAADGAGGLRFRLGRIPIHMPWSSFVGILVIAFFWLDSFSVVGGSSASTVTLAATFAVLLYVSILGHELAHAWVARAVGYPVTGITLWMLGGYTSYERAKDSAGREALIAASGPISSVLIGIACNVAAGSDLVTDPRAHVILVALGRSNILLGIFNALPGLPLDGGAVLKAMFWAVLKDERRATIITGWSGRVVAVAVFLVPQYIRWRQGAAPDVGSILIGLLVSSYLYSGASAALKQAQVSQRVPTLSSRGLARAALAAVHDTPLSEALRRRDESGAASIVVVDTEGRPRAVSQEAAIDAVPLERRPWVPVSAVAVALDPRAVLVGDLRGEDLITAMLAVDSPQYLVVDADGSWFGTLSRADVEAALSGRR